MNTDIAVRNRNYRTTKIEQSIYFIAAFISFLHMKPQLNNQLTLLRTEEPVKITLELKNLEGFESESATLTCDLSKLGRTDGQWLFNGQPLTTSERIQLKTDGYHQCVEFAELTIADAGQYTYRIENVSSSATLTVRGRISSTLIFMLESVLYESRHCVRKLKLLKTPTFVLLCDV